MTAAETNALTTSALAKIAADLAARPVKQANKKTVAAPNLAAVAALVVRKANQDAGPAAAPVVQTAGQAAVPVDPGPEVAKANRTRVRPDVSPRT